MLIIHNQIGIKKSVPTWTDFFIAIRLKIQTKSSHKTHKSQLLRLDFVNLKSWIAIDDKNHHIIVAEEEGHLVSSCVCVIIPNLTRGQRPYAFVENVITDKDYRKKGLATACLNFAKDIALRENC